MQVTSAYILVVLVWSTTPLAIHFSNSSVSFVAAITIRMVVAAVICFALLKISRQRLITQPRDGLLYAVSGLGLFPNMLLVYWAAQYIPSGLMSVIMGIYPFFVGVFSLLILRENPFTRTKFLGLGLAVIGLLVIHHQQVAIGPSSTMGLLAMIVACAIWGLSTVLVKKLGRDVSPLRQGTGSLFFACPFYIITWWIIDGALPTAVDQTSVLSITYLILMGSVISHTAWFYVLQKCSVVSVSLVTLITPIMAITWGVVFAGESFTVSTMVGATTIVLALTLYQGILPLLWRKLRCLRNPVAVTAQTVTPTECGP